MTPKVPTPPADAHVRVLTTEFPTFLDLAWTRLGPTGSVEFWVAPGGGEMVLRVVGERSNQVKTHRVPPNGRVIVERLEFGIDGYPSGCRITLPVEHTPHAPPLEPPSNVQT